MNRQEKSKIKIAYVHSCPWPSKSPGVTFTTYSAASLAGETRKCHLFVKAGRKTPAGEVFSGYFNMEKPPGLKVHRLKHPIFNSNRFYYRKVKKQLEEIIRFKGLDAVITRRETFLPYLVKLKEKYGISIYFESHNFFSDLSVRDDINPKKKLKQHRVEKKYIGLLDGLICLQESQKDLYEKVFPGLDKRVFRTGIPGYKYSSGKRVYITYIGSLDSHKGIDTLLEAAALCRNRIRLLIIGGRTEKKVRELENLVKEKYSGIDVKITGWLEKKEIERFMEETLLGVIPLKDTFFNRNLTSPLKLFDYFSHGIPAVASDLHSARELIDEGNSGVFFRAEDPADLAEKIDTLVENKNELDRMRRYIFENTSQLLWESRSRYLIQWIEGKISSRGEN